MRSDVIKFLTPRFAFLVALGICACGESRDRRLAGDSRAAIDSPVAISADASTPGAPCPAGAGYTISDTSDWATMIEEGKRAVLRAGSAIIDTVDVAFGVHAVGHDSLVFLPVVAYDLDSAQRSQVNGPTAAPEEHVLCTPSGRRVLSEVLPHFNSGFSSPTVIDSAVYYWGLKLLDANGRFRLYAMRFAPRTARVDSVFLREEMPATDFRYFYTPAFEHEGAIVFEGGGARTAVDPATWRVLRSTPASAPSRQP